jgi:hypothetical protein
VTDICLPPQISDSFLQSIYVVLEASESVVAVATKKTPYTLPAALEPGGTAGMVVIYVQLRDRFADSTPEVLTVQ